MGKIKGIKDAIVTTLQTLQYNGETAYGQVVSDTRPSFETYPAARVILNGQPNEVSTNRQNERTTEFLVISYFEYKGLENEATTFDLAYDFNDLVIDALDALQPGFTVITQPVQSTWEIIETKTGNILSIMATVRISYSHDVDTLGG